MMLQVLHVFVGMEKSETKLLDIFVCYTHIVIALHSNSHNFKVGERIFFWQPYLLF